MSKKTIVFCESLNCIIILKYYVCEKYLCFMASVLLIISFMTISLQSGCLISEPINYEEPEEYSPVIITSNPSRSNIITPDIEDLTDPNLHFTIQVAEYNTNDNLYWRAILYTPDNNHIVIGGDVIPPSEDNDLREFEVLLPSSNLNVLNKCYLFIIGITDSHFSNNTSIQVPEGANLEYGTWWIAPYKDSLGKTVVDLNNCPNYTN